MKKISSEDIKTVVVRFLNKDEKLNVLRRKRLDLINELKNIKYLVFCSFLLLPILPLIYFKWKNHQKIIKIKKINQKIIETGGFEPKYQEKWNIKKTWKF